MTEKQQETYIRTKERLRRLGKENPADVIVALAEEIDCYREKIRAIHDLNGAFKALCDTATAIMNAWDQLWKALVPMIEIAAKDPRTRKLIHLAKHGKNKRIRKKNAKRLFRIMKGE